LDSGWHEAAKYLEPSQPCSAYRLPQRAPLCKGVLTSHGKVTARADGHKIIERGRPALGFWDIVAGLKVIRGDYIRTPGCLALPFEFVLKMLYP
jgi:hypothetical protein